MASLSTAKSEPFPWRGWCRVGLIALVLLIIIAPHLLCKLFMRATPFARFFLKTGAWLAGARVTVQGKPIQSHVLYIANHVSWLDILILSGHTGCAFIAKADMAPWPVLGWLATQNNSVYVERDNRRAVLDQAGAVQNSLLSGQPLCLFPEGTTANGRTLLPFRSSLIAAVTPAPEAVQIQPVALDYGPNAPEIAWVDDESVGTNALRVMSRFRRLPVRLTFLAPLDHADFADRKAIAAHSRAEIAEALGLSG